MVAIVLTPFDDDIEKFNKMYRLPAPQAPTLDGFDPVLRFQQYERIFGNELDEGQEIVDKLKARDADRMEVMVDLADWFGDLAVYATSEALRYGIRFYQEWRDARLFTPDKLTDNEIVEYIKRFTAAQRSLLHMIKHDMERAVNIHDYAAHLQLIQSMCAQQATVAANVASMQFSLPICKVLSIIMQSNFSKLGADGMPIYDADFKVQKGPNYWKPEPKIKEMLEQELVLTAERIEADKKAEEEEYKRQRAALGGTDIIVP